MASSEAAMMMISNPLTMPSTQAAPPAKKKRNLPGTPDPDAEVIALSPRTLLATNRFVCEICGKGFQRDQNLQLHRRGHNLPWKLRQRSGKEPRKRVYVCPEKSCVHHNPTRALGDLTGIKKHFCRKHGEKKWKCDKCSKKYAVQSDWKAHSKTCGTREYRCDCGTLFSRRDSFITHRAFCDALAEETARLNNQLQQNHHQYLLAGSKPPNITMVLPPMPSSMGMGGEPVAPPPMVLPPWHSLFDTTTACAQQQLGMPGMGWLYGGDGGGKLSISKEVPSLFSSQHQHAKQPSSADMSATALLQKAAQIGAVTAMPRQVGAYFINGPGKQSAAGASQQQEEVVVDKFDGGLVFGGSQQQNASSLGNVPFDAVLSAVRNAGLKQDVAVGREETRDFLGVGVQALCSSSLPLHGWI